ncbi:MutS-related protein [Adhaeribacter aquaticus]|uniref:MutS-related protein n=1 Tax=Adhaeribacter aquaticus TaxID=299567 RepID=UPI0004174A51|nr:hypothetical protein [Adhaeribacter aquaticus]
MVTDETPVLKFESRIAAFTQQQIRYTRKSRTIGWLRLAIFLGGVGGCYFFFDRGQNLAGFSMLICFYIIFLIALKYHTQLQYQQKHYTFLTNINKEEVERLKGNLHVFDPGNRYQNSQHLYTSDLDIFGRHSLYQLLNRAITGIGQDKLAAWLQAPAPFQEISSRQEAVATLAPAIDWRQELQAKALHYKHTVTQPFQFFDWLNEPTFYKDKGWLKALIFVLPPITIAGLYLLFTANWSYLALAGMISQYLLGYKYSLERDTYYEKSSGMYEVLQSYRDILKHIENYPTKAAKIQKLQQQLQVDGQPASRHIHSLTQIVEYLSARMNVYVSLILNTVLMWDFFWMWRLDQWKARVSGNMQAILEVVAETEALASLAAFKYANPSFTVPQISSTPFEFVAQQLGHPLIFSSNLIKNNFRMAGKGHTGIITGSNMSGKSTFLRTVGINLVLAQAGAVVCADNFLFYPMQVYTAMRTEDNLAESTSSFYAELKRLRMLLDLTITDTPVFYLLDEILKGTNSGDRHAGAKALILQLHKRNASGLVSTHDLELGALEQEHPDFIQNYSFNSIIEGDKIIFDYKLHPGICKSFNASKLMQLMGIEM